MSQKQRWGSVNMTFVTESYSMGSWLMYLALLLLLNVFSQRIQT